MDSLVYIQRLGHWLQQQGFRTWPPGQLPDTGVSGAYFYRLDSNSLVLIKLVNAGDYEQPHLLQSYNLEFANLEQLRTAKGLQFATQVVINICDGPITHEIREQLLNVKKVSAVSRCYLLSWVVDLVAQKTTTHKGMPFGNFGLFSDDSPLKTPELVAIDKPQTVISEPDVKPPVRPRVVNRGIAWVSYSIIVICVLLAIMTHFTDDTQTLVAMGAKVDSLIAEGQYWRLFTAMFLHAGFLHLAFNMVFLYYMGPTVERFFGRWRYLVIFLLAGVVGNVASFAFSRGISVGASGALFGLMGAYLYFWWRTPQLGKTVGRDIIILILFNLAYGQINPAVDNWAHLGGLFGGFLSSVSVGLPGEKVPAYWRVLGIIALACLLAFGIVYGRQALL